MKNGKERKKEEKGREGKKWENDANHLLSMRIVG
jgi:hypothetical protein